MVKGGEAFSHKCSRITDIKICNPNFHKEFVTLDHSCSSGQKSRSGISLQDGQLLKISKSRFGIIYYPIRSQLLQSTFQDSSNWKLHQKCFLKITKLLGTPSVDLFASRLCHQLPQYMAWKPDPNSFATDAMQQNWNKLFAFAFPPFSFIGSVINKVIWENVATLW